MDKTIKTRDVIKDIKVLDKKAAGLAAVRDIHTKVKEVAERAEAPSQQQQHGADYAQSKVEQGARGTTRGARRSSVDGTRKAADAARNAHRAAKDARQVAAHTTKRTIKQGTKGGVKTTAKSIKTAGSTAGKAVKTSKQTAQAGKAAAKATQIATRNAAQAARAASRATAAATKAAVKAILAFVRMAVAAVKSLVSAIAAGGWVAVAIIVVICLVGLIAGSAYGIFFSGGDMGDGNPTLREVVARIDQEYQAKIDKIKADNPHDEAMITGTRAPWSEVLAVYAVRTTTNSTDPAEIVTLDEHRQQMLKDIYWSMNTIDFRVEDRAFTEIVAEKQADGTVVEKTQTTTRRTLYITQSAKSAKQMADAYGFNTSQREMLAEMLSPQFASAWQSVLYGSTTGSGDMVKVAASQIGNPGGAPYWSWYGFSGRVEWCACFVSWCADQCGYIKSGAVPKYSYCQTGMEWFQDAGRFQPAHGSYTPKPGDIVFFDWEGDGHVDHTGIVEYVKGGELHTIEGNNGDAVRRDNYSLNSSDLAGYGLLN